MNVLIIENDVHQADNLQEFLEIIDCSVLVTYDSDTGIRAAKTFFLDLILCDISIDEKTGFDILEELRADAETAKIPFVFVTAMVDKPTMDKVNSYDKFIITKPYSLTQIENLIFRYRRKTSG